MIIRQNLLKPNKQTYTAALLLLTVVSYLCVNYSAYAANTEEQQEAAVKQWIETWGDKWWERYHPDLDAQYPGGRSNKYHDLYIAEAMKRLSDTSTSDWKITNKHYIYDGDWFAVEWLYQSTQTSTGLVQRESTVAFGQITDDHLKIWVEYFDDMVGHYQWIGAMPMFEEDEMPFPWPKNTPLTRKYRP